MTGTAIRPAETPGALPAHPLDPVTAAEYLAGRDIMAAAGLLAEPVRFAYYGLEEPSKDEVLAGQGTAGPHQGCQHQDNGHSGGQSRTAGCARSWST